MNAIRFLRLKKRMSYIELSRRSSVSPGTIRAMEEGIGERTSSTLLLKIANALGVTIDALEVEYPEDAISLGDHPTPKHTATFILNPIGRFCRANNITLPQLANLLGKKSRQAAARTCTKQKVKLWEIQILAQIEGISAEEFMNRYKKEDAA